MALWRLGVSPDAMLLTTPAVQHLRIRMLKMHCCGTSRRPPFTACPSTLPADAAGRCCGGSTATFRTPVVRTLLHTPIQRVTPTRT